MPATTVVALHQVPPTPVDLRLAAGAPTDELRDRAERLFRRRRVGGIVWTVIGGSLFIRAVSSGVANDMVAGALIGGAVVGGIPIGIGLGKLNRFSFSRQNQALGTYDNTGSLPGYVMKRLD